MAVTNKLKVQVDTPVWEWCRFAPILSGAMAGSCSADNSNFHVQHGRYIYYLCNATNFYRYDTITDAYIQLASPLIAPATWMSMRFSGAKGYEGRVLSATNTTLTGALLFGQILQSFDIRITGGTGIGQRRVITAVGDRVIADYGTASAITTLNMTDNTKAWQFNQWVGYQVRFTFFTGATQIRKIIANTATQLVWADVTMWPQDHNVNAPLATAIAIGTTYQIESSTLTVDTAWSPNPDATSRFVVESGGIYMMSAQTTPNYEVQYYDVAADIWYIKTCNTGPLPTAGTDGTMERTTENSTVWDRGTANATLSTTTVLSDPSKSWVVNQWVGYYVRIFTGVGEGQLRAISENTATTLTWVTVGTAPTSTSRYLIVGFDAGTATVVGSGLNTQTVVGTASMQGNTMVVTAMTSGTYYPGMVLSGTGVGAVLNFTNATSSAAVVTVASTTGIQVGMVLTKISGTGTIVAGTIAQVINVLTATTFTITQTPTAAFANPNTCILSGGGTPYISAAGATSADTTITATVSSGTLYVGMGLACTAGTGTFASGSTVVSITDATHFVVSVAPSVALSGGASVVVGTWPMQPILGTQISGTPGEVGTYYISQMQQVASTDITGTGVATLGDTSKSWPTNRWNNLAVRITAGQGKGQVRSIQGTYANTLMVVPNWTTVPNATSTYEIQGDVDKLYMMFGASAQVFIHNISADLLTTGRMVEYGWAAGGFCAQYSDYPPIPCSGGTYSDPLITVTTVFAHNFKTGMTVTHYGDTGAGKALNNIAAVITVLTATTYTYSVGAGSAAVTVRTQGVTNLTDATKNWVPNQFAGATVTFNSVAVAQATGIAQDVSAMIIGNSNDTLIFPTTTTVAQGISRYVITNNQVLPSRGCVGTIGYGTDGLAIGAAQSGTVLADITKLFTSATTSCSSVGTTITTTGYLRGLQVGMYLAVTGGTGAFTLGASTATTLTQVVSITDDTHFEVSAVPATALSGATVTGTHWPTSRFVNRKCKIYAGTGSYAELTITANTTTTLTFASGNTTVTGFSQYAILDNPVRGAGVELSWASGLSDTSKRGSYMFAPRGGAAIGFDRLNIQTDSWDLMSTSPQTETLTTGSMYTYDGGDRLYYTKDITMRVYYLDLATNIIHGAGVMPYIAPTSQVGNIMEIFTTVDGLKYMWVNHKGAVECYRQLLWY
jgi:hypothetical protein